MTEYIIDGHALHHNLGALLSQGHLPEIKPLVDFASDVIAGNNVKTIELNLPEKPSKPSWDKNYMTPDLAVECQEKLSESGGVLHLKCPVYVKNKREKAAIVKSHFDIYIAKDGSDRSRKPRFIREGITIPEDRSPKVRDYISLVVIEEGPLATLLGDSENPAHTEWEKNASKFKGKYQWGSSTIDFVRLSVSKALRLLSQGDNEEDYTVLSDIFYLQQPESEEDVPSQRLKKKKKVPGTEPEPAPTQLPKPRSKHYRLSKIDGGFVLRGPEKPLENPRDYKITVAYDFIGASKSSALKKYHKNDFALDKAQYVCEPKILNVENLSLGGNTIEFTAIKNNFEISVAGFDPDRDIIVDVQSKKLEENEAI